VWYLIWHILYLGTSPFNFIHLTHLFCCYFAAVVVDDTVQWVDGQRTQCV